MRAIMFSCVTAGAAAGITDARASGRVRVVYSIEHILLSSPSRLKYTVRVR